MGNYGAFTKEVFNTVKQLKEVKDGSGKPLLEKVFTPPNKEVSTDQSPPTPNSSKT